MNVSIQIINKDSLLYNGSKFVREDAIQKPVNQHASNNELITLAELAGLWGMSIPLASKVMRGFEEIGDSIAFLVGREYRIDAEKAKEFFKRGDVLKMKEYLKKEGRWI